MSILSKLIKFANLMDKRGLYDEADQVDSILICLAMSVDDARNLLGVLPGASPEEINKAYMPLALENHPDRGGDEEKMKLLNHARDILLGRSEPERMRPAPTPQRRRGPSHEPDPEKTEKITWDEAASQAGVPLGAEWKFVTNTSYGPYLGDTSMHGFVVYGVTDREHVFVGVYNYVERNYYSGSDINKYIMSTKTLPKEADLSKVGLGVIKELWSEFNKSGQDYSRLKLFSKVAILPEGTPFNEKINNTVNNFVSFKTAMYMMGISKKSPLEGKKLKVVMSTSKGKSYTLYINDMPFQLSDESSELINSGSRIRRTVFPDFYGKTTKTLNRIKKGKQVIGWLAANLVGIEPVELTDALQRAYEQMK
jgi:hypothetical protein